eukprot:gene30808-53019_t
MLCLSKGQECLHCKCICCNATFLDGATYFAIGAQSRRFLPETALQAFYADQFVLPLPAGHRFPMAKYRMLRDRISRALPAWSEGMPDHHAILGLHAFGLEETGQYARAEAAGRRAIELEPRNGWAQHAVAHVLEMQDCRAEGIAWMRGNAPDWTPESFFAIHNWWHLA